MFCPKCGSQNSDETRFCRGCGSDISNVLALVENGATNNSATAEKEIDLFSSGLRGLIIGAGFFGVAILAYVLSPQLAIAVIFALAFASFFIGTGISRLVQARALRGLRSPKIRKSPELATGGQDYIGPSRSIYETEDLATPRSITENTTTHLELDPSKRD
jgi:hypothetical protein